MEKERVFRETLYHTQPEAEGTQEKTDEKAEKAAGHEAVLKNPSG